MQIDNRPTFKGISPYNITARLEDNVLLNKALFDVTGSDAPWVIMANNKQERRERLNRAGLSFGLIFVSPLLILPFINRFAMKNAAKLTTKLFSDQYNAIKLSNKFLSNKEATEKGLNELSKELKIDFKPIIDGAGKDFEKLRKQIIKAKNIVLATDFLLVAGTFGHIGFFNNWQTKKKTGQKGYSAEMEMADKSVVEKRAAKYEKTGKLRYGVFLTTLAGLAVGLPLAIKQGLTTTKTGKFNDFVKKHAQKFDYTDAIFMKRWPLALSLAAAHVGVCLASRNQTELKDNSIRSSASYAIFFGGDILLASVLGQLSDKIFKTKIIKHNKTDKSLLNKILPSPTALKELENGNCLKTKRMATGIFWVNFVFLSALMGFAVPHLINKIIKKDVSKDIDKKPTTQNIVNTKPQSDAFKQFQTN